MWIVLLMLASPVVIVAAQGMETRCDADVYVCIYNFFIAKYIAIYN